MRMRFWLLISLVFLISPTWICAQSTYEQRRAEIIERQDHARDQIQVLNKQIRDYNERLSYASERFDQQYKQYEELTRLITLQQQKLNSMNEEQRQITREITLIEENLNEKQADQIHKICDHCYHAMNDDFNTALTIGHLFNLVKKINSLHTGQLKLSEIGKDTFERMKSTFLGFSEDVLGLQYESGIDAEALINIILKEYAEAKQNRDFEKVDRLRAELKEQDILVKDMKDRVEWGFEE